VVLKKGGIGTILFVSTLHFLPKSEGWENGKPLQFQDLPHLLGFLVGIVVQFRALDIRPYIALLEVQEKAQTNNLMKIQVREYIEFVRNFTESTNIMTKHFFIVVPYSPAILGSSSNQNLSGISSRLGIGKKKDAAATKETGFDESRSQLEERLSVVEQGLTRSGVRVARLGTEEVIELFYKAFNPGETEKPIKVS